MRDILVIPVLLALVLVVCGCVDPDASKKKVLTSHVEDWRDEIIYQLMVDRFANGDLNNDYNVIPDAPAGYHGGDYQGVIDHLDYLVELGVTTLWISPVVKNVEEDAGVGGYHGYWTQNFLEVNPHFGDMAKLREMVDACHERGLKVVLDIVTNHIGQLFYYDINKNGQPNELVMGSGTSSPLTRTTEWDPDFDSRGVQAYTSLGASGLASVEWIWDPSINRVPPWPAEFANEDWYHRMGRVTVWGRELDACLDAGIIDQATYESGAHWSTIPDCYEYVRLQETKGDFPGGLKDINTERDDVREALTDVYAYWIEAADFDGFRIDTIKHVEHGFWQTFCPEIRKRAKIAGKRNFFMFGEAFDGNDALIGSFTENQELDSVFYFSQKYTAFDGVFKQGASTKSIEELWSYRFPGETVTQENQNYGITAHMDGPTDAEGQGIPPYKMLVNFLDNHDIPRFLFVDDGSEDLPCLPDGETCDSARYDCNCDTATLRAALALLLTMDGIPCLYYGTEQNFNGGNDPANREDLWNSGFDTSGATFHWIQKLIGLRKHYTPLRRGEMQVMWSTEHTGEETDAGIFAFERSYDGETVLVVLNAHKTKTGSTNALDSGGGEMSVSFTPGTKLIDEMDGSAEFSVDADGTLNLSVPPQSVRVLVAR